jgi:solute carrier family 35, member E1
LFTGFLFLMWYAFNIIFNLMNKQVLNAWSKPLALSTVQLAVGSVMVLTQWGLKLSKRPKITRKLLKALFLPTLGHLVGHVSTCVSFSYVAVSFAHIVKAAEPAVSSLGSALFLGEIYSPAVYLSLLPIIAGVSLSAVSELSFSWAGFLFAMLSNVAFAARNVFSKRNMGDFKDDPTLTPANIYGIMSIIALLVEIPFALAIEGIPALPSLRIGKLLLGSGVFYTLYNTVSFMALGRTGVLTHAVGNILKRASVIVVSILFFRTPIRAMNGVGMGIAIAGTALYAFAKRRFTAKSKLA